MVWQKGITRLFKWTNIIIPIHKHVNISVFFFWEQYSPDLIYKKMTHSGCAKITCHGYYWNLHQWSQVFFPLICRKTGRKGGREGEREGGKEGGEERKSERKRERMESWSKEERAPCS